ncbi:hypothetical protein QFZ35_001742 [Arthrobacter ulcerisalmonis]|nr:hypothetical protein [Arthrobacter ulcerisalmonis]
MGAIYPYGALVARVRLLVPENPDLAALAFWESAGNPVAPVLVLGRRLESPFAESMETPRV